MSGYRGYQHARISARNPRSLARCQRCGRTKNRYALAPQFYWEGPELQNTNVYVCIDSCLDIPNEQLRTLVLPPDPVPIFMPQIEDYEQEITTFFVTEDLTTYFTSEDGETLFVNEGSPTP